MTRKSSNNTPVTRRKFLEIASVYGLTATLGARSAIASSGDVESAGLLQSVAERIAKAHAASPEYTIRMGVSGATVDTEANGFPVGYWEFAKNLAERTDGRIKVQLFGSNALCTEVTCAQKFSTNTIQAFGSSSQNASLTYPFLTALDFPYLFPTRASLYHFLYSPKGDKVFRQVLRDKFDYEYLWALAENRVLFLGKGWSDKPDIRSPEQIESAKIRVTASPMARIALDLLGANPIPLDWAETYEGLKSGVVDGIENFPSAAPAYGMTPAISQAVNIEFFAGLEHAAISRRYLEQLPDELREAVMESAFHTQQWTQAQLEHARSEVSGLTAPPKPGTVLAEAGVRYNDLTAEELANWRDKCSPQTNPDAYAEWRDKLGEMAGGVDVYDEIHKIAREIPADTPPTDVPATRWWLG